MPLDSAPPNQPPKLGQILIEQGEISEQQLEKAIRKKDQIARDKGQSVPLGVVITRLGFADKAKVEAALRTQKEWERQGMPISSTHEVEQRFGELRAREYDPQTDERIVDPAAADDILLCIAGNGDPVLLVSPDARKNHLNALKKARQRVRQSFQGSAKVNAAPELATRGMIAILRERSHGVEGSTQDYTEQEKAFRNLVLAAYERGATDIHFFRNADNGIIRLRIRGSMRHFDEYRTEEMDAIISVGFASLGVGGKNIGWDRNQSQRRRIQIQVDEYVDLDLRYEHAPGDGETYHAVIRVLANDKRKLEQVMPLTEFGFTAAQERWLKAGISKASGLTIIAGPTGSGKSTTMAQLVKWVNKASEGSSNILTVEAPVERRLPAFQMSVSDDDQVSGNEYADAIKGMLRRDPDFMLVGELRDPASASAAISGVQSGHPLLTTVHAQSAIEIVERMTGPGMKVPPQTVGSPSFISCLCYQMLLPELDHQTKIAVNNSNIHEHLDAELIKRIRALVDLDQVNLCVANKTPANPDGTASMTICAEVIMPDETMLEHFRRLEITEAARHWRELGKSIDREGVDLDEQVVGLSAKQHAIEKMARGLIDPRDVEDYFGYLTLETMQDAAA